MMRVLLAVLVAAMFGLAGCEKKETPGQQLDQAIEKTEEAAQDAKEEADKAVEEAKEAVPAAPAAPAQ